MAATYRFKTVMVTDFDREEFTKLRDSFGEGVRVTDKELFAAMFDLVDTAQLRELITSRLAEKAENRERDKIARLEAKLKEKLEKLKAIETKSEPAKAATA